MLWSIGLFTASLRRGVVTRRLAAVDAALTLGCAFAMVPMFKGDAAAVKPAVVVPDAGAVIRLFIQIVDERQRAAAAQLQQKLDGQLVDGRRIAVQGIERLAGGGDNSLRCLKVPDCKAAGDLAQLINAQLAAPNIAVTDLSARFDKAPPSDRAQFPEQRYCLIRVCDGPASAGSRPSSLGLNFLAALLWEN